jgi:hypothetical protein
VLSIDPLSVGGVVRATHSVNGTIAAKNLTNPEASGPGISSAASFEHAIYEARDIAVAAFFAKPDVSLVPAKPPKVPIVALRELLIIGSEDPA